MACEHNHDHMTCGGASTKAEFLAHLPYSIFGTVVGMLVAGGITIAVRLSQAGPEAIENVSHTVFHIFHPIHMLLSATATTAMFYRHERHTVKAAVVGLVGAIGVCGISDVLMPYLSGIVLFSRDIGHSHHVMHFHWCVMEHPWMVLPFAVAGIAVGLTAAGHIQKTTFYSHSAHVLISSVASIFYLIGYGLDDWISHLGYVLVVITAAVMIPCCFGDILFPLMVTRKEEEDTL